MVTRCIKALDRLDEVSQRLYKKSSVQGKIIKIESRLNQLTKKPSRDDELRERRSIKKKKKYQAVCHDTSGKSVINHTFKGTQSFQQKFQKNSGSELNGCRRTKKVQVKHPTIREKCNSKLPRRKHNVKSVSVDETSLKNDEKCVAELKSPRREPLSWEEQINSEQVKILEKRQPSITTYHNNEIDSHPVVFHDKKWVEEMLHKKATQVHLSSCCPRFQENEERKSNKRRTVKCLNTEQLESSNDKLRLQLRGRGVPFYSHEMDDELNDETLFYNTISGIVPMTAHYQDQQSGQNKEEDNNGGLVLFMKDQDTRTTNNQCGSTDTSLRSLSFSKSVVHPISKQYVDISVCVPNAHCVEEQADESCSLLSETKDLNFQIKSLLSSSEISVDGERQYSSAKSSIQFIKSADKSRPVSKTSDLGDDEKLCSYKREDSSRKKRMIHSSHSSPNAERIRVYSESPQRPSSLVYIPSSPPLFLANEVLELPRGVSPSKALMELRQSFCENIRKETKQLEFDLQELYLKKQLHKR